MEQQIMKVRVNENRSTDRFLTPGKEYEVLGLDHESFRILDDKGEPILFPKTLFTVIDKQVPADWIWDRYGDDEYYANPPELHEAGFYEDLFDHKPDAVNRFDSYLRTKGICRDRAAAV